MTLASSDKNTKSHILMYYTCSLTIITCNRLSTCSTNSLKLHHIYWNIYVGIIDAFCIAIEKLVCEGSSTCLERKASKAKTPATIQTRVS